MIISLSPELQTRLFQALLCCVEFDNAMRLEGELAKYNRVFERAYAKKEDLVTDTIRYLTPQRLHSIQPVLPLFLKILQKRLGEEDELRYELEELYDLVIFELKEHTKSLVTQPVHTAIDAASPREAISFPSSLSPVPTDSVNDHLLDSDDYKAIERLLMNLLDIKGTSDEAKKRLLRDGGLPDAIINTIHFYEGSSTVATEIIGLTIRWDQQDPRLNYLENLVQHVVREAGYTGNPVETAMNAIIARYNQTRTIKKYRQSSYEAIATRLQEARNASSCKETAHTSSYKIDLSLVIQCNLGPQRKCFTMSFNERFRGFFTFAVACTDRAVLENYVLGSLLWELQKNTPRPTKVHHIPFYTQDIDCSSIEQGNISLQQQILQFFQGKSLRDVFEDRPDDNLAIILWPTGTLPYHFKEIALQFSEAIEQQVRDLAHHRCFLIFWANYGLAPIEPLEISVVLPPFERFEIEHIFDWWDVSLSYQLKEQHISEQDIQHWRKLLAEKVKYHHGYLPWTYHCLLEPLERRGAF